MRSGKVQQREAVVSLVKCAAQGEAAEAVDFALVAFLRLTKCVFLRTALWPAAGVARILPQNGRIEGDGVLKFKSFDTRLFAALVALAPLSGASAQQPFGVYGGVTFGAGFARSTSSEASLPDLGSPLSSSQSSPAGDAAPAASLVLGKQWRAGDRFGFGLEFVGTFQGSAASVDAASQSFIFAGPGSYTTTLNSGNFVASVPFQSALRLRAAFALTAALTAFASVGPALGVAHLRASNLSESYGQTVDRATFAAVPFDNFSAYRSNTWRAVAGLDVAAGVEAALGSNVKLRAEYSLTQFQTIKQTVNIPPGGGFGTSEFRTAPLFQRLQVGVVREF